jgi:hypothetical protein
VTEKRKRQVTVFCNDGAWSEFQGIASQTGKTAAEYLGEIIEREVIRRVEFDDEQARLPEAPEGKGTGTRAVELPPRVLIGFGKPAVRIR